eukprot:scaffold7889_cov16-Tisochrysis_lutea.AAC.1
MPTCHLGRELLLVKILDMPRQKGAKKGVPKEGGCSAHREELVQEVTRRMRIHPNMSPGVSIQNSEASSEGSKDEEELDAKVAVPRLCLL